MNNIIFDNLKIGDKVTIKKSSFDKIKNNRVNEHYEIFFENICNSYAVVINKYKVDEMLQISDIKGESFVYISIEDIEMFKNEQYIYIYIENGFIQSTKLFETLEEGKKCFKKKIIDINPNINQYELEDSIEKGYFENNNKKLYLYEIY